MPARKCAIKIPPSVGNRASSPLYSRKEWKTLSQCVRTRNPICQFLDDFGVQCTSPSTQVHHLVDIRDDQSQFFKWSNLVAVCNAHHQIGERGETQGYKYCHTIGWDKGIVYEHGFNYPFGHEKHVLPTGKPVVAFTTSNASAEAIKKALAEPI